MKNIKSKKIRFFIVLSFCISCVALIESGHCEYNKKVIFDYGSYTISLNKKFYSEKERMVAFNVEIIGGKTHSLLSAPEGWNIIIDNNSLWKAKIDGSCAVGAAALIPDAFNNIVAIEKNEYISNDNSPKLDVTVNIIVTEDFESDRTITYKIEDLIFDKITK